MRIAVVGLGYWGPNLIRNFAANEQVDEVICFDIDSQRSKSTSAKFPKVHPMSTYDEVLDSDCAGIALAVPVSQHYPLGIKALQRGKHLLVEKPMAVNALQCEEMIRAAEASRVALMVDHTFVYTGAVRKMKEIVSSGGIGDMYYFDSVRARGRSP